jgi:hypothetical protein
MRTTVLISTLALGVGSAAAAAQQFPYREPGPYRTAFIETATKACIREALLLRLNADDSKETVSRFCDCKVAVVATFLTSKDLEEIAEGGVHVTRLYRPSLRRPRPLA